MKYFPRNLATWYVFSIACFSENKNLNYFWSIRRLIKKYYYWENIKTNTYLTLKNFLNLLPFLSSISSFILWSTIKIYFYISLIPLSQLYTNFNFIIIFIMIFVQSITFKTYFACILGSFSNFSLVCTYFSFYSTYFVYLVFIFSFVFKNAINFSS